MPNPAMVHPDRSTLVFFVVLPTLVQTKQKTMNLPRNCLTARMLFRANLETTNNVHLVLIHPWRLKQLVP